MLKDPGDDIENKIRLVEYYTSTAYVGERLEAFVNILNDSLRDSISAIRICRPLVNIVANRDSANFVRIRDKFTPEKFERFMQLYDSQNL